MAESYSERLRDRHEDLIYAREVTPQAIERFFEREHTGNLDYTRRDHQSEFAGLIAIYGSGALVLFALCYEAIGGFRSWPIALALVIFFLVCALAITKQRSVVCKHVRPAE